MDVFVPCFKVLWLFFVEHALRLELAEDERLKITERLCTNVTPPLRPPSDLQLWTPLCLLVAVGYYFGESLTAGFKSGSGVGGA